MDVTTHCYRGSRKLSSIFLGVWIHLCLSAWDLTQLCLAPGTGFQAAALHRVQVHVPRPRCLTCASARGHCLDPGSIVCAVPTWLLGTVSHWQSWVLKFPASTLVSPSAGCELSLGNYLGLLGEFSSRKVYYGPPVSLSLCFLTYLSLSLHDGWY